MADLFCLTKEDYMGTRQYIGARYVPKFADPIAWDSDRSYEALTIVTYLGTSYTSKKDVPVGTAISNTEYWVATGNYNSQVEEYAEIVNGIKDDGVGIATVLGVDNTGSEDAGAQINALWSSHKTIYLPAGEYNIETPVSIPSNGSLIGENGAILLHNVQENPGVFTLDQVNNVKIINVTVKGDVSSDSDNNVSTIYKSTDVIVDSVRYINIRGIALIVSTNCKNIKIKNCYFNNCGTYNRISGDSSDRVQALAVTTSCENIQIVNNTFDGVGLDAISVTSTVAANIAENYINDTDAAGIYISSTSGAIVEGNIVHDAGGNGIDSNSCALLNVIGNYCYECGAAGIMLANPQGCSIVGNACYGNVKSSGGSHVGGITIHTTQNSSGLNISDNFVYHASGTYELYSYYHLVTSGTLSGLSFNETNKSYGIGSNILPKTASVAEVTMGANDVIKFGTPFMGTAVIWEENNAMQMTAILRGARTPIVNGDSGWIGNASTGTEKYLLYYDSTDNCYYLKNNQASSRIVAWKLDVIA